ncbi:Rrf2 family transcriptional regulator [Sulfuritalea sp.]|uniref:RrF2 family transcriptional regulator n=1 Tax=Sulfuritalea sp. TaxID=2480090 RepID=UPI0025E68FA8|nr:Rrf2 family transcriptional regulator [Sulfuritalea sp.]
MSNTRGEAYWTRNLGLRFITRTNIIRVMAHITNSVEYGIHCLLWLVDPASGQPSSRDLAELQGISPSFVAKIFPKLEKAGIVQAAAGVRGGYRLARLPTDISVLDIVDAIEGHKPLFDCQEIRDRCAVFENDAPGWATAGVCAIHAAMLRAEQAMRESLARETLAEIAAVVERKAPKSFPVEVRGWLNERTKGRATRPPMKPPGIP